MSVKEATKPYAVLVTIGEKKSLKEFGTEFEMNTFLKKAEELKKKAPNLLVQIVRQPQPTAPKPVKKRAVKEEINDPREDSICWKPRFDENGRRKRYSNGELQYQIVQVPFKSKKVLYCPYCNCYKDWGMVDMGYGLKVKGCTDCGMTENDFNIKTANGLWKMKG